jgi:hypothetical protein
MAAQQVPLVEQIVRVTKSHTYPYLVHPRTAVLAEAMGYRYAVLRRDWLESTSWIGYVSSDIPLSCICHLTVAHSIRVCHI